MVDAVDEDEAAIEGQFTAAARGAHFYLLTEAALHRLPMNPVNVVVGATLLQTSNSTPGKSIITGQPFESHSKNSSRKALFSCDWAFQEKELCCRFRSWRVSAGGRAPMNYDSFYPTFCAAAQA